MIDSQVTLDEAFRDTFTKYRDRIALNFNNLKITYGEIQKETFKVANALLEMEIKKGTRIALLLSNRPEYVYCQMAIYQIGAINVPLNHMLGKKDINYMLKDSGAKILIVEEDFFEVISNMQYNLPELKKVIGVSKSDFIPEGFLDWHEFKNNVTADVPIVDILGSDSSQMVYTGGTTGNSKGVLYSHKTSMASLYSALIELEITENDKLLLSSPLSHAAGTSLQSALLQGAEVFIEQRFDLEKTLYQIEEHKITYLLTVPTMLYRIIDSLKEKKLDTSSLKTIVYGTAPISPHRLEEAINIFGPIFIQTFGLTETPVIPIKLSKRDHLIGDDNKNRLSSCGRETLYTKVRIVDNEENEVPDGKSGEIIIFSPATMTGYYKHPIRTHETLKNGWLYTGDIGMKDEKGYIYILDRKKDMIISGGMNVYSTEVEDVIDKYPSIDQVAVIGIPDSEWGEAVTAIITIKEEIKKQNLIDWLSGRVSSYEKPKNIYIVDKLPLTSIGKIDKKKLRDSFWKQENRKI